MKSFTHKKIWPAAVGAFLIAAVGCGRNDVKVYHVETNDLAAPPPAASAVMPAMPNAGLPAPDNSGLPSLKYILPAGWTEKTPGQMRVASFDVTNADGQAADIGVIPLPVIGRELQIVNMWRDQLQLPAATNTEAEAVTIGNSPGKLFNLVSAAPLADGKFRARILVAMLTRGGTSWFFKMTGADAAVTAQRENFLAFLKSVSFVENAPAQIAAAPTAQGENQNSIWTVPADWQPQPPSQFLTAQFLVSSGGAKAEVNVSELGGSGGGLLANVNRWRGQLGLNTLNEMELAHLDPTELADRNPTDILPDGSHFALVDFTGTNSETGQPARLVAAVIPQAGQTWFYKLMGDDAVVAQQKDAFVKFIESAKYPDAR